MNVESNIDKIVSRHDLAEYVATLRQELLRRRSGEDRDLPSYLEAMSAWISDMDGFYDNIGEKCPDAPTWRTLAQIITAATVYE
jgi:hypothetical protein